MSPAHRLMPLACLVALCAAMAGCVFGPGKAGSSILRPWTLFGHREASASDRAERRADEAAVRVDAAREDLLRAAQREVHRGAMTIEAETILSRPVVLTTEAVRNASAALDQALGPLPADQVRELRERVAALLSEVEAVRTAAEQAQARDTAALAETSRRLVAAEARALEMETVAANRAKDLREAFERENALANIVRGQRWAIGITGFVSLVAGAGWLYLRLTSGRALGTIIRGIDGWRAQHSASDPAVADLLTKLSAGMSRWEKKLIHKVRGSSA
jgi:hypothetical protein